MISNDWFLICHNVFESPQNIFILLVCNVIDNIIIWHNILIFIIINWTYKIYVTWFLCSFGFMVINNFNNTDPENLAVLSGKQEKYVVNNGRWIKNRHLWCIGIPSFTCSFILRKVLSSRKTSSLWFINIIKTWHPLFISFCIKFDKWIWIPTKRVKAKVVFIMVLKNWTYWNTGILDGSQNFLVNDFRR